MYPYEHGMRHNGKYRLAPGAVTIAEILQDHGYRTAAFVAAYVLNKKYGLSQGFDLYDDDMPGEAYQIASMFVSRPAELTTQKAVNWLEKAESPFFLWVHYFDPHSPYNPPAPFRDMYENPYDAEIAYVDQEIGKLLESVTALGFAGETLIVSTADHGESLGEHGELTHGIFLYSSTTRVPLFMSLPGTIRPGARDSSIVELVDLVPTILSILGYDVPKNCGGRVLLEPETVVDTITHAQAYSETWAPRLQYGWSELRSLRDEKYLYIQAPAPELYDLAADPHELVNRFDEESGGPGEEFASRLDSLRHLGEGSGMSENISMGQTDFEALENLGYVFRSRPSGDGQKDPKDMIGLHDDILEAYGYLREGNTEFSLRILQEAYRVDDRDPVVNRGLGLCYSVLGQDSLSLTWLTRAIELDPLEERTYYDASKVLTRLRRYDEATEMLETLVGIYTTDPLAWLRLAKARSRSGDGEGALEAFRTAIVLDRNDYRLYRDFGRFLTQRGSYEESLEMLRTAIRLKPDCAACYAFLGASQAGLGQLENAAGNFRLSLEADSTAKNVWLDLGRVEEKLGNLGEARRAYETVLSLDPSFTPAKNRLDKLTRTNPYE